MIYLLHFTVPLGRSNGTAATHYLGYCAENGLDERLHLHRTGRSRVKILMEVLRRGGDLILVRTWPHGGPSLEQYLKRNGHLGAHCPICRNAHLKNGREKQRRYERALAHQLELPSARPLSAGGTASRPPSGGGSTSSSSMSRPAPRPASTTSAGTTAPHATAGGSGGPAPATRSRSAGT